MLLGGLSINLNHLKSLSNSGMQQKQQLHNSYNTIQSPTIVNIHYRNYLYIRKHNIFEIYVKLKVGEKVKKKYCIKLTQEFQNASCDFPTTAHDIQAYLLL